ncbi:MAG: hypothetical protein LUE29_07415 [Lachnospiraceae bacterium]|nr:hypothetical protein [Lachnospiraceae bacterium]
MGFLDALFGGNKQIPPVTSILPDAARREILAGRLPRLNTDTIFLKRGEYCCYIDKAILLQDKTKKIYRHAGTSSPGLFKDTRMNFGVGDSKEYVETQQFRAILYITNQRIILNCKDHGFDRPYKQLSAVKPFTNGMELQYGEKTYTLVLPDGNIPYQVIKMIQQRRSY